MQLETLATLVVLAAFAHVAGAIKFRMDAERHSTPFCVWNYALRDTLAIISVNVVPDGQSLEQSVDVKVIDRPHHNVYLHKRGLHGETRLAVSTHRDADLGVCFTNQGGSRGKESSIIDLDVQLGGDAVDYNAIANQESLSGMETELRKLTTQVDEVLDELEYMKKRQMRLSETHASTLLRVHGFAWLTFAVVVCLGVWQVYHLRGFFKRKYLID